MAWKDSYLDLVLIPAGIVFPIVYHVWLWHVVRRRPLSSTVGINTATRRLWVLGMMKVPTTSIMARKSIGLMDFGNAGQREEGGAGGAVDEERDNGVDADGDDGDPLLHRRRRHPQQHVHRQEAAQRRRVRRPRRVHDGAQVRHPPPRLPPLLPLPHHRHLHPQPGHLPPQHPPFLLLLRRRHRRAAGDQGLRRRRARERIPPQPRRKPAVLRRRAASPVDLRPGLGLPLLRRHDPDTAQHRRGLRRWEQQGRGQRQSGDGVRER